VQPRLCRESCVCAGRASTLAWCNFRRLVSTVRLPCRAQRAVVAARVQRGRQLACFVGLQDSFGAHSWLIQREGGNVMMDSPRFDARLLERIKARARGLRRAGRRCRLSSASWWHCCCMLSGPRRLPPVCMLEEWCEWACIVLPRASGCRHAQPRCPHQQTLGPIRACHSPPMQGC